MEDVRPVTSASSTADRRARSRWAVGALSAVSALALTGCGGDDCDNCFFPVGPPGTPTEVSLGLVAGNFAGNGLNSVIQTRIIDNGSQPNPGSLKIYLTSAAGTYAAPILTPTGNNPTYLAAAVLTSNAVLPLPTIGGNLPDLVVANAQDGTLGVYMNSTSSPGTFAAPVILDSPGASQVAIADVNGDGLLDLVSADYNVSLFLQTSAGTFANPIELDSGGANWVAVGDLNHDGSPDIAITDNSGVKVVFHTGAVGVNTYAAATQVYTESRQAAVYGANIVAIADVNGDGYNDLVIADPGPAGGSAPFVAVMLQSAISPGTFAAPVPYATAPGSLPQSIQVIDINGDGLPDVILGGDHAVSVLLNSSTAPGTFGAASNYAAAGTNEIAIADVNGDGLLDIVTATGVTHTLVGNVLTNEPGVLLQNAAAHGTFTALQNLP